MGLLRKNVTWPIPRCNNFILFTQILRIFDSYLLLAYCVSIIYQSQRQRTFYCLFIDKNNRVNLGFLNYRTICLVREGCFSPTPIYMSLCETASCQPSRIHILLSMPSLGSAGWATSSVMRASSWKTVVCLSSRCILSALGSVKYPFFTLRNLN